MLNLTFMHNRVHLFGCGFKFVNFYTVKGKIDVVCVQQRRKDYCAEFHAVCAAVILPSPSFIPNIPDFMNF